MGVNGDDEGGGGRGRLQHLAVGADALIPTRFGDFEDYLTRPLHAQLLLQEGVHRSSVFGRRGAGCVHAEGEGGGG